MKQLILLLFILITGSFVSVNADHLEPKDQARGKPEKTLAGINLDRSSISDVIKLYGKPSRVRKEPKPPGLNVVDIHHYYWTRGSTKLHVVMYSEYMGFIEVQGPPGSSRMVRTGRGLKIGDDLADVRRIYGPRFKVRNIPHLKIHDLMIQWRTKEYSLVAGLDQKGRIKSMVLSAPE
ncbi:MAG TPA: hypothetical protein VFS90_11585 [Pyrinomonadaceae bacterium]|nr:hypothetical protein [Pyrinomonadaceae bacterium]